MLGYTWLISNYYVLHYTLTIIVYYLSPLHITWHYQCHYKRSCTIVTVPEYTCPDTERHNMGVHAVWSYEIQ